MTSTRTTPAQQLARLGGPWRVAITLTYAGADVATPDGTDPAGIDDAQPPVWEHRDAPTYGHALAALAAWWNDDDAASSPTDELAALHPAHRHIPGAVATLVAGQDTGGPCSEGAGTPVGVLVITRDH